MYVMAETSTGVFSAEKHLQGGTRSRSRSNRRLRDLARRDASEVDKTGIDIAYSCTQKGLSCPPGLSPITVSPLRLSG